jgi:hypothetical protein
MKKSMIMLLLSLNVSVAQNNTVYFEKNSDSLNTTTRMVLDSLIKQVKKENLIREIAIYGHTDTDASNSYNNKLAYKRAIQVREYLLNNGLKNKFYVFSKGENASVNNNSSEAEKAKNRRVEIITNFKNNNSIFQVLKTEKQKFIIQQHSDTTLVCKNGTKIYIPKNCFNISKETKEVVINIQEYTNKEQFIKGNLTTKTTDGNILESGGMIYIEALSNGKKISLQKGKNIEIEFSSRKENDNMEIFYGRKENNEIVWNQGNPNSSTNTFNYYVSWGIEGVYYDYKCTTPLSQDSILRVINENFKDISKTKYISYTASISNNMSHEKALISSKLGWINCDRFYRDSMPKTSIAIQYKGDFIPTVYLVFKDINAIMTFNSLENEKIFFNRIPIQKNVKVIAFYKGENDSTIKYAEKDFITKDYLLEKIDFKEITQIDLEKKLSSL